MNQPLKRISIANIGAVNSGKSTLMGRLLFELNPTLKKIQSWHQYTDSLQVERDTNKTLSVGHQFCDLDQLRLHFKDDPGHEAFAGQTVSGLVGADIVFYVINGAQWDEPTFQWHQELLQWFQPQEIICLVNQCDKFQWQTTMLDDLKQKIKKQTNPTPPLFFVSGATGEGLTQNNPLEEPPFLNALKEICQKVATKENSPRTGETDELNGFHWAMNSQVNFDHLKIYNSKGAVPFTHVQSEGTTGPLTKIKVQLSNNENLPEAFLGIVYENEIIGILKPTES